MKEIKRLTKAHHEDFKRINAETRKTLANPSWFMPFSEEVLETLLNENSPLVVYGCFIDGTLAGVSLFDTTYEEFAQLVEILGVTDKKVAELGGSMVLPEFRGQHVMYDVNVALMQAAREMGIEYFVATAHPDNIASNSSLKKLGMELKTTITRAGGYLRNVYLLKL